jgi:hypothetical protein
MTEQDIIDAAVTVYSSKEFESERDLRLSVKGFVRGVIYMNDYIRSTMNAALIDESSLRRHLSDNTDTDKLVAQETVNS